MKTLVVIGNFDGVHRGHQAVLEAVRRSAEECGLAPRLLTFHPHPAVTLGRTPPPLLTRIDRKIELAQRVCPQIEAALIEFTPEFARQSPEEFVERVLVKKLDAAVVRVGENFRFGRNRTGGLDDLERLGATHGFEVAPTELVGDEDGPWSSTRIRALVADGDMVGAAEILGRPHMVSGTVSRGDQRGRTLGFPTANISDTEEALPPFGVYAVLIDQLDDDGNARALARGVANLGVRPTIGGGDRPILEAHAFDFSGDLYGARLRVHMVERLREERKFDGLDALRSQIARDSEAARTSLSEMQPVGALEGAWA